MLYQLNHQGNYFGIYQSMDKAKASVQKYCREYPAMKPQDFTLIRRTEQGFAKAAQSGQL